MLDTIIFLIFMLLACFVFYKWCIPVIKEENKQAKKKTEELDLELEKLRLEIKKLKGE